MTHDKATLTTFKSKFSDWIYGYKFDTAQPGEWRVEMKQAVRGFLFWHLWILQPRCVRSGSGRAPFFLWQPQIQSIHYIRSVPLSLYITFHHFTSLVITHVHWLPDLSQEGSQFLFMSWLNAGQIFKIAWCILSLLPVNQPLYATPTTKE